jgi:N-dimethylarginine dimethylaminohydrolase
MMGHEIQFHIIELPKGVQHTLGIINFLNRGRIAVWKSQLSEKNLKVLQGISSIEEIVFLEDDDELSTKRSMNWVFVKENSLVMPGQAPKTSEKLKGLGLDVHCVDISEYIKCGGGIGCATGVLCRIKKH